MRKFPIFNFQFPKFSALLLVALLAGCYEPKEGCLDIDSVSYDPSADDPCPDCCEYPVLTVAFQHQVGLADTSLNLRYDSLYPSPFDPAHYFSFERSRFFISNIRLLQADGVETGITDTLQLISLSNDTFNVERNFVKADRDIIQTATVGHLLPEGVYTQVKFTLGLLPEIRQTLPDSSSTSPLTLRGDTLIYETGTGYLSNQLIFRPDTLPATDSLVFRFQEVQEVLLDIPQPLTVERGFNIELTLRVDYLRWFDGVDLANDLPEEIRTKIESNLTKAFSVAKIELGG